MKRIALIATIVTLAVGCGSYHAPYTRPTVIDLRAPGLLYDTLPHMAMCPKDVKPNPCPPGWDGR